MVSTLNNDGSLYIIERMTKVARAASEIRREHMQRERDQIMANIRDILDKEYDSENEAEKLMHSINTALALRWEFDISCTHDNYYFGHLLQAFPVSEAEYLQAVHKLVHGTAINNDLNNLKEYELIRRRCNDFGGLRDRRRALGTADAVVPLLAFARTGCNGACPSQHRCGDTLSEKLRPKTNRCLSPTI